MQQNKITFPFTIGLIALAYMFSVGIRFIWVYYFASDYPSFLWNNEIMITTNDGYYFANGVKAMLEGTLDLLNPRELQSLNASLGLSYITYALAKFTPLSLETVILYMPAFVSSLIVVPIILICRLFNLTLVGFFAALLGAITHSYYNRTMVGYYDSDMFALLFPFVILYFIFALLVKQKSIYALWAGIAIAIFPLFYAQGLTVTFATLCLYLGYVLWKFRDDSTMHKSAVLLFVSIVKFSILIKIPVLILLYLGMNRVKLDKRLWVYIGVIVAVVAAISTGLFMNIINYLLSYTGQGTSSSEGLNFFQVNQTVREASGISMDYLAQRISGHPIILITSILGYILLLINHKKFIVSLPLFGLGLFALFGGLRFTVYAVPLAAISFVYISYIISEFFIKNNYKYIVVAICTALAIWPNINHILNYKTTPVFSIQEVQSLEKLKKISNRGDYTLTWWDYGYPIWFYSNTHTLIDGAKHNQDNFIISKVLSTDSQAQAVNLSRVAVEAYVKDHKIAANTIFEQAKKDDLDSNEFLKSLKSSDYKLPIKTRDIYLYLPYRMLNIFPTVNVFSNLDLEDGTIYQRPFLYRSNRYTDDNKFIYFQGKQLFIDKELGNLHLGNKKLPLHKMIVIGYEKNKMFKKENILNSYGNISVIYLSHRNTFIIADNKMMNSVFFKLFIFEEYDKNLFEPVITNHSVKVYKLKK